jgi:hypothetical protein
MALLTKCNLHPCDHDAFIQDNSFHHGWANINLVRYNNWVFSPADKSLGNKHPISVADEK